MASTAVAARRLGLDLHHVQLLRSSGDIAGATVPPAPDLLAALLAVYINKRQRFQLARRTLAFVRQLQERVKTGGPCCVRVRKPIFRAMFHGGTARAGPWSQRGLAVRPMDSGVMRFR